MNEETFFDAVAKTAESERRIMLSAIERAAGDPRACRWAVELYDIRTDALRDLCMEMGYLYDAIVSDDGEDDE